jgi:hypothetical protein
MIVEADFVFTVEEQEFFSSKGYTNEPKRCPACRQTRKEKQGSNNSQRSNTSYQSQRQMYPRYVFTLWKNYRSSV